jgi:hypothetical protein
MNHQANEKFSPSCLPKTALVLPAQRDETGIEIKGSGSDNAKTEGANNSYSASKRYKWSGVGSCRLQLIEHVYSRQSVPEAATAAM